MKAMFVINHNCIIGYSMFLISHAQNISANNGGEIWNWFINDTVNLGDTLTN